MRSAEDGRRVVGEAPEREAAELLDTVARAQEGDRRALEQIFLSHFDRIYTYLHMTVGDRDEAEELTNETFVEMLESIDAFDAEQTPLSAWLFHIAHALAAARTRKRRPAGEREEHETEGASMIEMIERLPHDQREVLTLRLVFNFSYSDVSTVLGTTERTVKDLQQHALAALATRARR